MIARLTGQLAAKELDHVIVDVSGVGYLVSISANCFYFCLTAGGFVAHPYFRRTTNQPLRFRPWRPGVGMLICDKVGKARWVRPRSRRPMLGSIAGAIPGARESAGIAWTAERILVDRRQGAACCRAKLARLNASAPGAPRRGDQRC